MKGYSPLRRWLRSTRAADERARLDTDRRLQWLRAASSPMLPDQDPWHRMGMLSGRSLNLAVLGCERRLLTIKLRTGASEDRS